MKQEKVSINSTFYSWRENPVVWNKAPGFFKHAFLQRDEARPKSKTKGRSLGIEHASFADLEKALAGVRGYYDDENHFDISQQDLIRLGLLKGGDSRKRREYLGEKLRIGYCNGKQLLKRLELFGIGLAEVEEVMGEYARYD